MKKLKNKVFWVIFSLLTIFTLIIFITTLTRTYIERKNSISDIFIKIPRNFENIRYDNEINPKPSRMNPNQRIYLDSTIYTILLDENGNYEGIINHTYNEEIDENSIKDIANSIISNHKYNFYIGNLYTNKYAYIFTNDNTLIIMDNSEVNNILLNQLVSNTILLLFCEIIIFIITYFITKWIITPVKNSFQKQKEFVADASHELKTPLSVMIASADAYFNDKNDKWVHNMKNESERMIKLVTELLDLAKTEQDTMLEQKDLSDIILSSVLTFESLFYDNKIKLKYEINPNINMLCNENLIIELVNILIDNAINHTKEKGSVFVNLYKKNKQIILEVKNKGIPIKKEDEEKIFERFYKVDTSRNRNKNNYGLGLAIAKNIVERHNGNIKAYSNDGYTTFKVTWNQK